MDAQAARQRVSEAVATAEFIVARYELVGAYVDANTRMAVVHRVCAQPGRTSLTEGRVLGAPAPPVAGIEPLPRGGCQSRKSPLGSRWPGCGYSEHETGLTTSGALRSALGRRHKSAR